MRLKTGYTRWAFKEGITTGIAFLLLLALVPAPAEAIPFFGKKKAPVEAIPPESQVRPTRMTPQQSDAQPAEGGASGVQREAGRAGQRQATPPDPLPVLVEKGIFPPDSASRTNPLNRAELANILVKTMNYDTGLVSEFPFYRDVPKEHWAYVPIEIAREKRLVQHREGHGYYYPERPVTYSSVYQAIAQAVTGPPPTPEATEHLLSQFKDGDAVPDWLRLSVAKLAQIRFFGNPEQKDIYLRLNEPVTPAGLAPLITDFMHVNERRAALIRENAPVNILPADLRLTVSPAVAIFENRLSVGESTYFTLVYPADPLPKGTTFRGTVREVLPSHTYIIELTRARTPEGKVFQTLAELTLLFPSGEKTALIVPGETFVAVTTVPPNAPASAIPVQPPVVQEESSAKKQVPPLTPPPK